MNYDHYLDLIEKEKYEEATTYKSSCIPDVLYKYFWLDDNKEMNELRLSTLERGELYLSTLDQFNDPFEGKAFVFEDDNTAPKGLQKEDCQNFINQINSHARICCFANPNEKHQNMPMWAYYANNHKGFCVEYELTEFHKKFIYPVSYSPYRVTGNAFIGNLILGIIDMIKKGLSPIEMPGNVSVYNHLVYLSLTCKHLSWQHEKEFRALVPTTFGNFFPIIPCKIYLGMNISHDNEKRLLDIANKFTNCKLYRMADTLDNNKFDLNQINLY